MELEMEMEVANTVAATNGKPVGEMVASVRDEASEPAEKRDRESNKWVNILSKNLIQTTQCCLVYD